MKVPLSWLREFVDVAVEPPRLGEDLTLVGLALDGLKTDGADAVLDLDITTNRVDCMNVYGVAREVSVIYGVPLRPLDVSVAETGPPAAQALDVAVEAPDLCPRFCARVLDVRLGPSPAWIRDRLEQVGVRPINNVVDLTNYVMMEMGHPSHAFDLSRLPSGRLVVRWGGQGERLVTLDGVDRALGPAIGVVGGVEGPLALAGIMGGAKSEVSEATRAVALEAAYWEPLAIRRGAKALGMRTEASHRFERGADPEGPPAALDRIAHLLIRIGAGSARPGLIDRYVAPRPRPEVLLRSKRIEALLGVSVPSASAQRILKGLGFSLRPAPEGWRVAMPSWRGDVAREADLIEEVGRHHGLGKIPSTVPAARGAEGLRPGQVAERAVREILVGAGLTEAINYAFVSRQAAEKWSPGAVALENPLAEDQDALRRSLVMPGLLATLRTNLRQGRRDVRVFELGRVFEDREGRPREEQRVGILLSGNAGTPHWSGKPRPVDFYDLKGLVEGLAARLRVEGLAFDGQAEPGLLHPGQAATVRRGDGAPLGYMGAVHPDVAQDWGLRDGAFVAELVLEGLIEPKGAVRFQPLPRSPAVERDVSVVCDEGVTAREVERTVRAAAGPLAREVKVADRYDGPPVPPGRVSLTLSLLFQDPARTLTGEEVQASMDRIAQELRARKWEIRGE